MRSFQERFKSEAVETDSYFLTVLRYIHQNPIRAKIVNDVTDYKWSSYSEYTESRRIIDIEYALNMFSDKPDEAVVRFIKFLKEANEDICLDMGPTLNIYRALRSISCILNINKKLRSHD